MGAPARTWFCANGHITEDYAHHELGDENEGQHPCSECGCAKILCVTEWQDEEYWDNHKPIVPLEPVSYVEKIIKINVPVFDVSKLFEKREYLSWESA